MLPSMQIELQLELACRFIASLAVVEWMVYNHGILYCIQYALRVTSQRELSNIYGGTLFPASSSYGSSSS